MEKIFFKKEVSIRSRGENDLKKEDVVSQ